MDAFSRLSPALQYQIVNGLGWRNLRPVQEQAIHAILDGCNCRWLSGSSARPRKVVDPGGSSAEPHLTLDFVGSLANAAVVVDRLYPGTRRLVFVDTRRRVEELGDHLRRRGLDVFLSHSSLAVGERRAAERAFEEGSNCVIVATSALELGIDVGDLDHVLQVDSPATVSGSFSARGRLTKFQPCLPEPLELDLTVRSLLDTEGARRTVLEICKP